MCEPDLHPGSRLAYPWQSTLGFKVSLGLRLTQRTEFEDGWKKLIENVAILNACNVAPISPIQTCFTLKNIQDPIRSKRV